MTAAHEAAERVFPRELAFQILASKRAMHDDRDRLRSFVGEVVIAMVPSLTGATTTNDGRFVRITFVWDTPSEMLNATKARLSARLNGILELFYPEAGPVEVIEAAPDRQFLTAVRITDQ